MIRTPEFEHQPRHACPVCVWQATTFGTRLSFYTDNMPYTPRRAA